MYQFYLDELLLPVAPSKLSWKFKNNNKTTTLISGEEINIIKMPGLTEFSFDALLPSQKYPFAVYEDNIFKEQQYFLMKINEMKERNKPFPFKVTRKNAKEINLFNNEKILVTLEDYTVKEDAKDGFDITVGIKLKQFREYGTMKYTPNSDGSVTAAKERPAAAKEVPTRESPKSYTVVSGDNLWNICRKQYGDGNKYKEIAKLNGIANPNIIKVGQVIRLE